MILTEQDNRLFNYCESHSTPVGALLDDLERETHLRTLKPRMLSGPFQGQILRFLSKMIQPKNILEIGTFTGYSAICLAQGLSEGGTLHTIEVNEELAYLINKYTHAAGLQSAIQLHIGDAKVILPTIDATFDLAFIDAGKRDNAFYYDLLFDRIPVGGYILVDNVLWHGKVFDSEQQDDQTKAIRAFNNKIHQDQRVEQIMLPIRDGLLLAQKISI